MIYANLDLNALAERWWVLVVRGIAGMLFGVLTFVWPGISLLALTYLWGAYALTDGLFGIVFAARAGRAGERWGWLMFEGVLSLGAAATAFVWPGLTQIALLTLIAVWAVLTGLAEIVAAIELRRAIRNEWLLALAGILSIAFGVLMLVFPAEGALAVVTMIGAYSLVFGVVLIALGVKIHRWLRSSPPSPTRAAPSHA